MLSKSGHSSPSSYSVSHPYASAMKLSQCHPLRCPVSHDGLWCRQFPQQHFSSSFIFRSLPSLTHTWCRVLLLPVPWLPPPSGSSQHCAPHSGHLVSFQSCVLLAHLPSAAYSNIRHGQLLFSVQLLLSFLFAPLLFVHHYPIIFKIPFAHKAR